MYVCIFMAMPETYGSSQARDPALTSEVTQNTAVKFLIHCTTVGTPVNLQLQTNVLTQTAVQDTLELGSKTVFFFPTVQQGDQVILTYTHYNYIFFPTLCSVAT